MKIHVHSLIPISKPSSTLPNLFSSDFVTLHHTNGCVGLGRTDSSNDHKAEYDKWYGILKSTSHVGAQMKFCWSYVEAYSYEHAVDFITIVSFQGLMLFKFPSESFCYASLMQKASSSANGRNSCWMRVSKLSITPTSDFKEHAVLLDAVKEKCRNNFVSVVEVGEQTKSGELPYTT